MTKSCLIFNPTARGDKAARLRKNLDALSSACILRPTVGPGTAAGLAEAAVEEGFNLIIAAGGDGTVNEVLNGMGQAEEGLARARLAVLPLGTANVFANEIGMPSSVERAWAVIQEQKEDLIDVGLAQYALDQKPCQRLFLQLAGAGIDSRAVELVVWEHKRRWGKVAYFLAGLRSLFTPAAPLQVISDGESQSAEQVLIGNGKFYGGRYLLFPRADLRDGLLEITLFKRVNWLRLARATFGMVTNQLYGAGGLIHMQTARISLESSVRVPFHVDGDNIGHLPVTFSIHDKRVRIIRP